MGGGVHGVAGEYQWGGMLGVARWTGPEGLIRLILSPLIRAVHIRHLLSMTNLITQSLTAKPNARAHFVAPREPGLSFLLPAKPISLH